MTKFVILARDIASGYVSVHPGAHDTEARAERAKDKLAWEVNRHEVTLALRVVEI